MGFLHGTHDRMAGLSYLKQVLMRELWDMPAVQREVTEYDGPRMWLWIDPSPG